MSFDARHRWSAAAVVLANRRRRCRVWRPFGTTSSAAKWQVAGPSGWPAGPTTPHAVSTRDSAAACRSHSNWRLTATNAKPADSSRHPNLRVLTPDDATYCDVSGDVRSRPRRCIATRYKRVQDGALSRGATVSNTGRWSVANAILTMCVSTFQVVGRQCHSNNVLVNIPGGRAPMPF
jgi:hypothetical protein